MKNLLPVRIMNRAKLSSILTIVVLAGLGFQNTFAGNVVIGGTMKVLPGISLVSVNNFVVKTGATVNNAGTLVLKKGLINENTVPNSLGTGTVKLMGTTSQTVSGQNTIQNLVINNPAGSVIGGNTTVNGILTLTSGKVNLGNYHLLLGAAATISGTPSPSKMIIVTATGELRKKFNTGFTGSFTFPVGDITGTAEYSPVKLTITGGTFATVNYIGVSLRNVKHPDIVTGNYLKRYWSISQSGITGLNCNGVFQYVPADVVGVESIINGMRITPAPIINYALANTVTHQLLANPINSFGTYTGGSQSGTIYGPTQIFNNSPGNVYVTEAGQTNYIWAVSPGGLITEGGTSTSSSVTITWNTAGPQTVSARYNEAINPLVLDVTVNPLPVPVTSNNENDLNKNLYDTVEKGISPKFNVYPVPNNGRFTISITSPYKENYTISIVNSLGAEVFTRKNLTVEGVLVQTIDIGSVAEGVYMVFFNSAKNHSTSRMIIRK